MVQDHAGGMVNRGTGELIADFRLEHGRHRRGQHRLCLQHKKDRLSAQLVFRFKTFARKVKSHARRFQGDASLLKLVDRLGHLERDVFFLRGPFP